MRSTILTPLLRHPAAFALLAASLLLAACTPQNPPKPAYLAERFSANSPFQHQLAMGELAACHLGQRALLSQGYQIDHSSADNIRGTKYFQPDASHQMRLEITLVCMPAPSGAVIYASALQTRYEIKTSPKTTGLSVTGLGSINLPWAEGKEALVKVGEETVADPDFYERFFELLKTHTE